MAGTMTMIDVMNRPEFAEQFVEQAIHNAIMNKSKLTPQIAQLFGMSGVKTRNLLNNLCALPDTNYLEIGLSRGSTFIPAIYGNEEHMANAVGIDNWQLPHREIFLGKLKQYTLGYSVLLEGNCFSDDVIAQVPGDMTVYFYDGDHTKFSQEQAITRYYDKMADRFVLLVDDWAWEDVREGTYDGIDRVKLKVEHKWEMAPVTENDGLNWWNGLGIFILRK